MIEKMPKSIRTRKLAPSSKRAITLRAKGVLQVLRNRGLRTDRDVGYALAATKMVQTVLEAQARAMNVPENVLDIGDELSADLDTVIDFLGLAPDDVPRVH